MELFGISLNLTLPFNTTSLKLQFIVLHYTQYIVPIDVFLHLTQYLSQVTSILNTFAELLLLISNFMPPVCAILKSSTPLAYLKLALCFPRVWKSMLKEPSSGQFPDA